MSKGVDRLSLLALKTSSCSLPVKGVAGEYGSKVQEQELRSNFAEVRKWERDARQDMDHREGVSLPYLISAIWLSYFRSYLRTHCLFPIFIFIYFLIVFFLSNSIVQYVLTDSESCIDRVRVMY